MTKKALHEPSERFEATHGRTHLLTDGSIELWTHIDATCAVPSFSSSTALKVKANGWIEAEDGCPYCATLDIDVFGGDGKPKYPLTVTFGNVALARETIELNVPIKLAVSAFIETGKAWDNTEAYRRENPDTKIGPHWFFPLGKYAAVEKVRDSRPRAAFYGIVRHVEQKYNSWTGHSYRKLSIECAKILYDAVVQDEVLPDVTAGNVVYVQCWLCAHHVLPN